MPSSDRPRGLPGVAPYGHPYSVFTQQVRQYRPSDLLPALAERSARPVQHGFADPLQTRPWAISAVARESIVRGSERRTKPVGPDTIDRLLHSFFLVGEGSDAQTLANLIVPIAYEQFPYQEAGIQSLARTKALLLDTPLPKHAGRDIADWESLFGMPLEDAWRTAFFLYVWAQQNRGRFDAALLDSPQLAEALRVHPRGHVELLCGASPPQLRRRGVTTTIRSAFPCAASSTATTR